MKKLIFGIVGTVGLISSWLAISNALPEYKDVFLVLIGVTLGFILGAFTPSGQRSTHMSEKNKGILFTIVMFFAPVVLLLGIIVVISLLGYMTDSLIRGILGWGGYFVFVSYIVAGCVSYGWSDQRKSMDNDKDDQN